MKRHPTTPKERMSHVTLDQTAIITVPSEHWPLLLQILGRLHQEDCPASSNLFITNAGRCNLKVVQYCRELEMHEAVRNFILQVRLDLPVNFTGNYHFQLQATA